MFGLLKVVLKGCDEDQEFLKRKAGDRFTAHWSPAALAWNVNLRAAAWMRVAALGGLSGHVAREVLIHSYSCDVTEGVVFEGGFHLPHPVGVVIGGGTIVGDGATIYQNVTLGANRHDIYPRLGRDVTIYTSSTVAGDIEVGDGSVIGAGVYVGKSVPEKSTVVENLR